MYSVKAANKEKIAVLVPYEKYRRTIADSAKRPAGLLAGEGKVIFQHDFKMTDNELLNL